MKPFHIQIVYESYMRICKDQYLNFYCFLEFLRRLFTDVKFSESGSNNRREGEAAYMFFINFMDDCEEGTIYSCLFSLE